MLELKCDVVGEPMFAFEHEPAVIANAQAAFPGPAVVGTANVDLVPEAIRR